MTTSLIVLPRCSEHDVQMTLRPLAWQTKEQQFCGVWYDCPACTQSVLIKSKALEEQLRSMKNR